MNVKEYTEQSAMQLIQSAESNAEKSFSDTGSFHELPDKQYFLPKFRNYQQTDSGGCFTWAVSPCAAWHLNKGVSHRLLEVQADSISFKQHGSSCQVYSDGPSHMRLEHVRVRRI